MPVCTYYGLWIFLSFQAIWNNFDFLILTQIFLTNFLAISGHLEQLWFFHFWPTFFWSPNIQKAFLTNLLTILGHFWNNFFLIPHFSGGGGPKIPKRTIFSPVQVMLKTFFEGFNKSKKIWLTRKFGNFIHKTRVCNYQSRLKIIWFS